MNTLNVKGNMSVTQVIKQIQKMYPNDLIRDVHMNNQTISFLRVTKDETAIKESFQLQIGT